MCSGLGESIACVVEMCVIVSKIFGLNLSRIKSLWNWAMDLQSKFPFVVALK